MEKNDEDDVLSGKYFWHVIAGIWAIVIGFWLYVYTHKDMGVPEDIKPLLRELRSEKNF